PLREDFWKCLAFPWLEQRKRQTFVRNDLARHCLAPRALASAQAPLSAPRPSVRSGAAWRPAPLALAQHRLAPKAPASAPGDAGLHIHSLRCIILQRARRLTAWAYGLRWPEPAVTRAVSCCACSLAIRTWRSALSPARRARASRSPRCTPTSPV